MRYFIKDQEFSSGPYDLLGIVRKVRNGSLHKHHMLVSDDIPEPSPAEQFPELREVFVEQASHEHDVMQNMPAPPSVARLFKDAFSFIKDDQSAIVLSGLLLLVCTAIAGGCAMYLPTVIAAPLAGILIYGCIILHMISVLRLSRMQLLSFYYLADICRKHGKALMFASVLSGILTFTLPWLSASISLTLAWVVALLISLPLAGYFLYVPFIIIDRNYGLGQALALNKTVISSLGINGLFVIIGLLLFVSLSVPTVLVALLMVPLISLALCGLYDREFNGY